MFGTYTRSDPLATPVAIIAHNQISGVHAPGIATAACRKKGRPPCPGPHTSDWRCPPKSPENFHGVRASMTVVPLSEALETRYLTEVHHAGYLLLKDGQVVGKQPRIAKDSIPWLYEQGYEVKTSVFQTDWDTPGHVLWTTELLDQFHEDLARAPLASTAVVYLSPRGARLVQPIWPWIETETAAPRIQAYLRALVAQGLPKDLLVVKDAQRVMRAAHHLRNDGRVVDASWSRTEGVTWIEAPPGEETIQRPARRNVGGGSSPRPPRAPAAPRPAKAPPAVTFHKEPPPGWEHVADALGAAIRDHVRMGWRDCYLALSGAMLGRGLDPAGLPAVIERVYLAASAGDQSRLDDRIEIAHGTVARHAAGLPNVGYFALCKGYPEVAEVLDEQTAEGAEARVLAAVKAPARTITPTADAGQVIRRAIIESYGTTAIEASTGTGKTTVTVEYAASLPQIVDRAPPGSHLAISVPTHELALQIMAKLPGRTKRLFSPLAHRKPDGTPTCPYHASGKALAAGGQSVKFWYCQGHKDTPCPKMNECPAYKGWEGEEKANLIVGPHALLRELDAAAGKGGKLVIDEPEEILLTQKITLDELEKTLLKLDEFFVPRYVKAIQQGLEAFLTWVKETAPLDGSSRTVCDAIMACAPAAPESGPAPTILELAQKAILPDADTKAPPMRGLAAKTSRDRPADAQALGAASHVLDVLWRSITAIPPWTVRVDDRNGEREATLCGVNALLAEALQRDAPVVLLDANASLHLPAITKVLGGTPPRFVQVHLGDGAPIERTIYATSRATRRRWLPRGKPDWNAGLETALRAVLHEAGEGLVGIITWKAIEDELRDHLGDWKGTLVTGHYGAIRGLDYMKDCDVLITLGDPRPNLGEVEDKCGFLDLDVDGRLDALAAAELEQSHGRLRTVHRTRPGRAIHVGVVVPGGWQGLDVRVLRLPAGRPPTVAAMTAAEFSGLRGARSQRAWATALKVSPMTVGRYETAARPVPEDVARAARLLGVTETPL